MKRMLTGPIKVIDRPSILSCCAAVLHRLLIVTSFGCLIVDDVLMPVQPTASKPRILPFSQYARNLLKTLSAFEYWVDT
jgi:hypothetical protein